MIIIEPFDKITAQDAAIIDYWVEHYGFKLNHQAPTTSLEYRLRQWNTAKDWLFQTAFEQNLILEKEIEIEADEEIGIYNIDKELQHFHFFYFIYDILTFSEAAALLDIKQLYYNKFFGSTFNISINNKIIKVQHGCKINRVLHKIAKTFKDEKVLQEYEEFATFLSQCSNQRTIKGTLCLSIHPMDFYTASDNDCGWDSCLSWTKDGGFSSGTIASANCPYLVMAYLKRKNDMVIFGKEADNTLMTWNNKRWREFFVVHPNFISGIKGYPYWNKELEKICISWLADLLGFEDKTIYHFDRLGRCIEKPFTANLQFNYLYNDYRCVGRENHQACINHNGEPEFSLSVAENLTCPICGDIYYSGEDKRVCPDCETIYYCSECDTLISADKAIVLDNDTVVCQCCYEEYYRTCENCGEEDIYVENAYLHDGSWYCRDCYNELFILADNK